MPQSSGSAKGSPSHAGVAAVLLPLELGAQVSRGLGACWEDVGVNAALLCPQAQSQAQGWTLGCSHTPALAGEVAVWALCHSLHPRVLFP